MSDDEALEVGAKLDNIWLIKGQAIGVKQKLAFVDALMPYPLGPVLVALDAHVRDPDRGRYLPMPADVVAQMEVLIRQDGRPASEEAWAIAVGARTELETVVWTEEIATAWQSVQPLLADVGDEVGARMAFRDTYKRLVDAARAERKPVHWFISEGHDAARRLIAVENAVRLGRLPPDEVPRLPAPPEKGQLLLGNVDPKVVPSEVRAAIERFRATVAAKGEAPGQDGLEKHRTRDLKAEAQAKVDAFQQGETDARDPA